MKCHISTAKKILIQKQHETLKLIKFLTSKFIEFSTRKCVNMADSFLLDSSNYALNRNQIQKFAANSKICRKYARI